MKNECLFCGIIADEVDSYKLYEDEHFFVILDRFPKCLGHVLILSKKHTPDLFGLPEEAARALMPLAQKIAKKMREVMRFDGFNVLQNNGAASGQQVMHYHLHLIPRYDNDNMMIQWRGEDPSLEAFEEMVGKIDLS